LVAEYYMYLLTIVINKMHKEKVKELRKIQKQGKSLYISNIMIIIHTSARNSKEAVCPESGRAK